VKYKKCGSARNCEACFEGLRHTRMPVSRYRCVVAIVVAAAIAPCHAAAQQPASAGHVASPSTTTLGATPAAGAIVIRGWDDRPEGRYGKFEVTVAGSDRYRITLSTPEGTVTQGLDGQAGWSAANDRVQNLSAADVARLRRIAMRYRPVRERPSDFRVVGIDRVADRDAYVATGRLDAITTQTLYFDAVTGVLRREVITTETLLLPLEEQVDYDDYRDVNGLRMPFQIRTSDGAPYATVTRTIAEIRRDVAVDDALFRPPTGSR